ncbi:ABC transporter permease [Actinacidiphila oryziradicis]|jgi:ABC-2 type transport system permease protein|uniref:ABC transporter permease n=1 Tax=Actinacidiphila oryziradicis TaxID=2571141 RepID=A0A4U0SQE5_9ACTN|nr:ABC transporter permease [Actinacidiphila oryziradicis]TKA11423.1 ABC transporter permease [Actinacidiphila oryziradicis]
MPPETVKTASPTAPDVIHNIGYRHYDGPRLGRAYARRSLFSQSLRGAYGLGRSGKSKVLPMILFAVMTAPALMIVAVALTTNMTKLPIEYTRYAIIMQAVIGLYLAAQAPQSVSRDLRFRVTSLYFSRPIERIDYVAAKFAAMTAALFILTAAPILILYVGALLAKFGFADQTAGFGKALVAVLLLSLLFSGIALVIAALTPRRGFGVAAIIAVLTLSYGAVTSVQGVALATGSPHAIGWLGLFSPITLIDGVQTWWLGASSSFVDGQGPSSVFAGIVYLLVVLGLIAGAFGLLMRRYGKVGLS